MTPTFDKDQIFSRPLSDIKAFEFTPAVTRVFRDMISRSVPGYDLLLAMMGLYANIFVQDNSRVYDLGCSLGDASIVVAHQANAVNFSIIAVDNAPAMIEQCRRLPVIEPGIDWRCEDIENVCIVDASLVILNLTLQFLNPGKRQALLEAVFQGLKPGGALALTEKVVIDHAKKNQRMVQLHQAFKKMQGYSELEISQKRAALEKVLVPDSETRLLHRLREAGFENVYECYRCFNFVSYLAIKA